MQTNENSIYERLKDLGIFTGRNSKIHIAPSKPQENTEGILQLNRDGQPIGKWYNLNDPANPIVIS